MDGYREVVELADYRSEGPQWRETVSSILGVSPLVIIDIRRDTTPLRFEIAAATSVVPSERLLFVGPPAPGFSVPTPPWVSEYDLFVILYVITFPHRIKDPEVSDQCRRRVREVLRLNETHDQ